MNENSEVIDWFLRLEHPRKGSFTPLSIQEDETISVHSFLMVKNISTVCKNPRNFKCRNLIRITWQNNHKVNKH